MRWNNEQIKWKPRTQNVELGCRVSSKSDRAIWEFEFFLSSELINETAQSKKISSTFFQIRVEQPYWELFWKMLKVRNFYTYK